MIGAKILRRTGTPVSVTPGVSSFKRADGCPGTGGRRMRPQPVYASSCSMRDSTQSNSPVVTLT
jgi:hypothetical protein